MSRPYVLGIDLGRHLGVARLYFDGTAEAHTIKLTENLGERLLDVQGVIKRHATPECRGVCIEEPFGAHKQALRSLYSMMGAAALACILNGLPWDYVNLVRLKKHATGKGNAKKPEMIAAAKARFGLELDENAADALWAATFALDCEIFATEVAITG